MAQVIAPLFSLSASGTFGKALLYYDTRFGARVRSPKKYFVPPGSIWEVNKEWFKKASDRSKELTPCQKKAWQLAYSGVCDTWRDIFMGQQIEAWNLSPENDLSWPTKDSPSVGVVLISGTTPYVDAVAYYVNSLPVNLLPSICPCWVAFRVLDDPREPGEADILAEWTKKCEGPPVTAYKSHAHVYFETGHLNYIWGGCRLWTGALRYTLVGSYSA
jgi:hypothetical protein